MRVLIIDDEANIRKLTAVALEDMGYETADAEDGATALEQLSAAHFDVAFLDLRLHDEDGMELLPKLLQNTPHLVVIVFSAHASRAEALAAKAAGAAVFMAKPFSPEQMRQALGSLPVSSPAAGSD
jgi:NtrC-family two-component system response regulator AlgB